MLVSPTREGGSYLISLGLLSSSCSYGCQLLQVCFLLLLLFIFLLQCLCLFYISSVSYIIQHSSKFVVFTNRIMNLLLFSCSYRKKFFTKIALIKPPSLRFLSLSHTSSFAVIYLVSFWRLLHQEGGRP